MIYCYHHIDLDGICAAAMLRLSRPTKEITFIPTNYPVKFPKNHFDSYTEKDTVYFLDISFSVKDKKIVEYLKEKDCAFIWIDHHQASIDLLNQIHGIYDGAASCYHKYEGSFSNRFYMLVDTTRCGSTLTYDYLTLADENSRPGFLKMVEAWDIHKTFLPYYEEAVDFLFGVNAEPDLSPEHPIWKELMTGGAAVLHMYVERGKIVRNFSQTCNRQMLLSAGVETKVFGIPCLAVNYFLPLANSMIFDSVRKNNADRYPLYMTWYFDGKLYHYSIYTENTSVVDCNAIAKRFGGGGHVGAAGFTSEQLLFVTEGDTKRYTGKE